MLPHAEIRRNRMTGDWEVWVDDKHFATYQDWQAANFVRQQLLNEGVK